MPNFNYFDVTISAIIILLAIKGFINGVIKEVFGLVGLIGGVYFASRFAEKAGNFIDAAFIHLGNDALIKLIGFMAVLIVIWLGATILGAIIARLTSISELSLIERILGLIAGGIKYFVIFALIVAALSNVTLIRENTQKYLKDSALYPVLLKAGSAIIEVDAAPLKIKVKDNKSHTDKQTQEVPELKPLSGTAK